MAALPKAKAAIKSKATGTGKGRGNSIQNLKPFQPGVSGNPAGRPKKIYTNIKKMGYSKDDITAAFQELCFYTNDDLKIIFEDPKQPIILKVIAKALAMAAGNGDMGGVKDLLQYVLGKPKQGVELSGPGGGNIPLPPSSTGNIDLTKLPTEVLMMLQAATVQPERPGVPVRK